MSHKSYARAAFLAALLAAATVPASASTQLVTNGNFETVTGGSTQITNDVTGWTNNYYTGTSVGYNFIFLAGTADTTGATNPTLKLWGSNDGGLNALTSSPGGGNFIANDGAYEQSSISQTINGLVSGQTYYLSFWWAGAQQTGFTGPTTDAWAVQLGASALGVPTTYTYSAICATAGIQCTGVMADASKGFTGWVQQGMTFTATSTSEVLSFLAIGTPSGQPPFALLDDVSLMIPEPGSLALIAGGIGALLLARARRKRAAI